MKKRKPIRFAVLYTLFLAALLGFGGCEQYQVQQYQTQPYPQAAPGGARWIPRPGGSRAATPLPDVATRIWYLTNKIRRKYGIPPLAQDGRLAALAQAYCDDMLRRRFFSHIDPEGLEARDRVMPNYPGPIFRLGENIWTGSNLALRNNADLARFIIDSWMKSPGHRENLLARYFTHLGVGVAGIGRELRAVQIFISLKQR